MLLYHHLPFSIVGITGYCEGYISVYCYLFLSFNTKFPPSLTMIGIQNGRFNFDFSNRAFDGEHMGMLVGSRGM